MAQPARHLQVVDPDTGELRDHHCEECQAKDDQIAGLEKDLRSWRARYADLKRDKEQEARDHLLWPRAKRLFDVWRAECRHQRSRWSADRFWLIEPLLREYGMETCVRAIAGAAYEPWTYERKNGSSKRCDEWERVFANAGRLEDFANRAPRGFDCGQLVDPADLEAD